MEMINSLSNKTVTNYDYLFIDDAKMRKILSHVHNMYGERFNPALCEILGVLLCPHVIKRTLSIVQDVFGDEDIIMSCFTRGLEKGRAVRKSYHRRRSCDSPQWYTIKYFLNNRGPMSAKEFYREVVVQYVNSHPGISYAELKEVFHSNKFGKSWGGEFIMTLPEIVRLDLECIVEDKTREPYGSLRFLRGDAWPVTLSDGTQVYVTNQKDCDRNLPFVVSFIKAQGWTYSLPNYEQFKF